MYLKEDCSHEITHSKLVPSYSGKKKRIHYQSFSSPQSSRKIKSFCSYLLGNDLCYGIGFLWFDLKIYSQAPNLCTSFKGKTIIGDNVVEHSIGLPTRKLLFMIEVQ